LSACETGLGLNTFFDGVIGLSSAFERAGARQLLVTLWAIDDAATKDWMDAFYQNMRTMPKDLAISAASSLIRKHPKTRHPYYWAGFTLSGTWQ
jgi:CHAT domain-containing protein